MFDQTETQTGFKVMCVSLDQIFRHRIWIRETMKPSAEWIHWIQDGK